MLAGPERISKLTGRPDVAVASTTNGASVVKWFGICGKEIA